MNFDIFDENYYLAKYPDLKAAKDAGLIASGLTHFQQFGLLEGRTLISPYYDEAFYRANNTDVDNAVISGNFASGLDHFIQFGYEQGITQISPYYVESFYLQSNPDVAAAIGAGNLKSGLEHYIKFGARENRVATSFLEPEYLRKNPDVAAAVRAGAFSSGLEHYLKFGQFEASRQATFVGTRERETVTAFGVGQIEIIGVEVSIDGNVNRIYESLGERDTLVGSAGSDTFVLGAKGAFLDISGKLQPARVLPFNDSPFTLATIVNFDPAKDFIQMGGRPTRYSFQVDENGKDLVIWTYDGGAAVIEGGASLRNTIQSRIKYAGPMPPFEKNFIDSEYLAYNQDVDAAVRAGTFTSGLEHYTKFGQFEQNRIAFFGGTRGNDTVAAFGKGRTEITGVERIDSDYLSYGENEFDTLIGSDGADTFLLGDIIVRPASGFSTPVFYAGGAGEARIVGFNPSQGDSIRMVRNPENYRVFSSGSDLIIAFGEDRIAVLEGKAGLTLMPTNVNIFGFTFV